MTDVIEQPTQAKALADQSAAGSAIQPTIPNDSPVPEVPMPPPTAVHLPIKAVNIMDLVVDPSREATDSMRFHIQFIDVGKNVQELPIDPTLLTHMQKDGVTMMPKSEFVLFQNRKTKMIERIRHMPKDIYKGWDTEDDNEPSLPDREVYQDPTQV